MAMAIARVSGSLPSFQQFVHRQFGYEFTHCSILQNFQSHYRIIIFFTFYYRASAVAASPVLATIGMSVCHTLPLCENRAD